MDGLTSGQHLDELADSSCTRFELLGVSNPVEDGVPIRSCERRKHRLGARIGTQRSEKIFRHGDAGLPGVGGLPPTVLFRLSHLVFAGSLHSAGDDQPFSDDSIPL